MSGGAGHMLHAIKSLKANRALLKKRKRKTKADVYGKEGVTKTIHKLKATPEEMEAIRKKIKAYKRHERRIWTITLGIAVLIICGLYFWLRS